MNDSASSDALVHCGMRGNENIGFSTHTLTISTAVQFQVFRCEEQPLRERLHQRHARVPPW